MAGDLTRVTINLTEGAMVALDSLMKTTGYSKTDVINRALRLYGWFADTAGADGQLRYIGPEGEQKTVVIL